jgi:hypothetical protein
MCGPHASSNECSATVNLVMHSRSAVARAGGTEQPGYVPFRPRQTGDRQQRNVDGGAQFNALNSALQNVI